MSCQVSFYAAKFPLFTFHKIIEVLQLSLLSHYFLGVGLVDVRHCLNGFTKNSDLPGFIICLMRSFHVFKSSERNALGVLQCVIYEFWILVLVLYFEGGFLPVELFNQQVLALSDAEHKALDYLWILLLQDVFPVPVSDEQTTGVHHILVVGTTPSFILGVELRALEVANSVEVFEACIFLNGPLVSNLVVKFDAEANSVVGELVGSFEAQVHKHHRLHFFMFLVD